MVQQAEPNHEPLEESEAGRPSTVRSAFIASCHQIRTLPLPVLIQKTKDNSVNIDCQYYGLGHTLTKALCHVLKEGPMMLESINIRGNGIGEDGCIPFLDALCDNHSQLRRLDISDNRLGGTEIEIITCAAADSLRSGAMPLAEKLAECVEAISDVRLIAELNLSKNNLGDNVVRLLAAALSSSGAKYSLKQLNLAQNNINIQGAEAIATMLSVNTGLEELDLSWNRIRQHGAEVPN